MYNYQHLEGYAKHRQECLLREAEIVRLLNANKQLQPVGYGRVVVLIGDTLIAVGTRLKARYEAVNTGMPEAAQGY
jgi:hypothetical protein